MLNAKRTSSFGHEYAFTRDGRELGTFSLRSGSKTEFSSGGADYRVRSHRFSGVYELLAADGTVLASTDRIGRQWTLHAEGRDHEFRRTDLAGQDYTMLGRGTATAGTIGRIGPRAASGGVDLPELKPETEIFVLVAVLLRRRRKRTAAAVRATTVSGG